MAEPRKIYLDADFRRESKTERYCCMCQKDIRPDQPVRHVHIIDGGMWVLHPQDEGIYRPDGGDCGSHLIGPNCARKLGMEWSAK